MKNIFQLKKASKRLPRLVTRFTKRLVKGKSHGEKLTDGQVRGLQARIAAAGAAYRLLGHELASRRIGQSPFRDATPHKKRKTAIA